MDLEPFLRPAGAVAGDADRALRRRARALQGGRRARRAWPTVRRSASRARGCTSSGSGSLLRLAGEGDRRGADRSPTAEVAAALDAATLLVLPSRSEGMGRVLVEAFCRGRGVVGSRVGGIPDVVDRRRDRPARRAGGSPTALADALVRVLADRSSPAVSARRHAASAGTWAATPGVRRAHAERSSTRVD